MAIFVEWVGLEQLDKLTRKESVARTNQALAMALTEEAQIMFRNSQRRVPVDTGTLRRSGFILPVRKTGNGYIIEMGYGGAASEYALDQHERADYRHAQGKTWKYLEIPVRERIPNLEANLKKRIERIVSK